METCDEDLLNLKMLGEILMDSPERVLNNPLPSSVLNVMGKYIFWACWRVDSKMRDCSEMCSEEDLHELHDTVLRMLRR